VHVEKIKELKDNPELPGSEAARFHEADIQKFRQHKLPEIKSYGWNTTKRYNHIIAHPIHLFYYALCLLVIFSYLLFQRIMDKTFSFA
jgi:hypothetical protein